MTEDVTQVHFHDPCTGVRHTPRRNHALTGLKPFTDITGVIESGIRP